MSTTTRNRRFSTIGTLIVSTLGLCALVIPFSPAKAQGCLGLDLNGACIGLQAPGPYYGSYYPYYGYPYAAYPYYGYSYPYYGPYYRYPY
jgi:hypothetical protein